MARVLSRHHIIGFTLSVVFDDASESSMQFDTSEAVELLDPVRHLQAMERLTGKKITAFTIEGDVMKART